MLFVIDFPGQLLSSFSPQLIQERVKELLYAHRLGRCLLVIERDSYNWISRHIKLSAVENAVMRRIYDGLPQTGRLRYESRNYIRLSEPGTTLTRINMQEIVVPLDYQYFGNLTIGECQGSCRSVFAFSSAIGAAVHAGRVIV